MELATYLWTLDKRWMYEIKIPHPQITWYIYYIFVIFRLIPLAINLMLIILTILVLFTGNYDLYLCF